MTWYLSVEQLVEINADQGGTVDDLPGVEACAHRPQSGAFGVDVFPDLWSKAAAYVHGIATTQYFSDGNKRTGWYAAVTFLRMNGHPLPDVETIEAETFVQAVAQNVFNTSEDQDLTVRKAAEWFRVKWETQRVGLCRDPRLEWVFLARFAEPIPGAMVNLGHTFMVGLALEQFPCRVGFFVVGRIHWDREDHQHPHELIVTVVPPPDGEPVGDPSVSAPVPAFHSPASDHPEHRRTGLAPTDFLIDLWPMIPSPGRYSVVLRIDGEAVAELPLDLHDSQDMTVDDEGLSEFIDGLA